MANPWLRLYAEFANDPKVQMLSEADQRRLIMLFCIRCGNGGETLHDLEVAFQLRVTPEEWTRTKGVFMDRGFIDSDNKLLNWSKRQFESDSSTVRVRRHREALKQEETLRNVSVTPPDTDTDTEQRKDTPIVPKGDEAAILDSYHRLLPKCQPISVLNPKRKKRIAAAVKLAKQVCAQQGWQYIAGEFWPAYFGECLPDPWLRGEVANPKNASWKQNLDVLIAEDRFAGIMDRAVSAMKAAP